MSLYKSMGVSVSVLHAGEDGIENAAEFDDFVVQR